MPRCGIGNPACRLAELWSAQARLRFESRDKSRLPYQNNARAFLWRITLGTLFSQDFTLHYFRLKTNSIHVPDFNEKQKNKQFISAIYRKTCSKMNSLFLYYANGDSFDRETILNCLKRLDGLSEIQVKSDEFAFFSGMFEFEDESNFVELKTTLEVFVLGRESRAAIKLAFDIQSAYLIPLNITNESNSFELCISDIKSFHEFERQVMVQLKE